MRFRLNRRIANAFGNLMVTAALLMITATLFGGCNTTPSAPEPLEGVADVTMRGFAFQPKAVTIRVGESVRWTNLESLPIVHTATSGDPADGNTGDLWNSGNLSPGNSFTFLFAEAGEFDYFCIPHQSMAAMRHAIVIVEP